METITNEKLLQQTLALAQKRIECDLRVKGQEADVYTLEMVDEDDEELEKFIVVDMSGDELVKITTEEVLVFTARDPAHIAKICCYLP